MSQGLIIFLSIIAGIILSILSNYFYDLLKANGILPEKPTLKGLLVIILGFAPFVFIVALPGFTQNKISSTPLSPDTNVPSITLSVTIVNTPIPTSIPKTSTPTVTVTPTNTPIPPTQTPIIKILDPIVVLGDDGDGVKWRVPESGTYIFKYESGSYSPWPENTPCIESRCWKTLILVFLNTDIVWNPDGDDSSPDSKIKIGKVDTELTQEEAKKSAEGGNEVEIDLIAGDYLFFIASDGQSAYKDNPGSVTISVTFISP